VGGESGEIEWEKLGRASGQNLPSPGVGNSRQWSVVRLGQATPRGEDGAGRALWGEIGGRASRGDAPTHARKGRA